MHASWLGVASAQGKWTATTMPAARAGAPPVAGADEYELWAKKTGFALATPLARNGPWVYTIRAHASTHSHPHPRLTGVQLRGEREGMGRLGENGDAHRKQELIEQILSIAEPLYQYVTAAHADAWTQVTLTMPQFKILASVAAHGRLDSPYLVRRFHMLPSTLTRIVDRLVAKGLVRRGTDPKDRRVVYLETTPAGNELVRSLTALTVPEPMAEALRSLPADELATVCEGLRIVTKSLEGLRRPEGVR